MLAPADAVLRARRMARTCSWPTIERLKTLKLIDRNGRLSAHTQTVTTEDDAVDCIVSYLYETTPRISDSARRKRRPEQPPKIADLKQLTG